MAEQITVSVDSDVADFYRSASEPSAGNWTCYSACVCGK